MVTVNTRLALWLRVFTSIIVVDEMMDLVTVKMTVVVVVVIIVVVVVVRTSFSGVTVIRVVPKHVESTVSYSMIVVVLLPSGQQPGHPQPPSEFSVAVDKVFASTRATIIPKIRKSIVRVLHIFPSSPRPWIAGYDL